MPTSGPLASRRAAIGCTWRSHCAITLAAVVCFWAGPSRAIEPNRTITQCLHRIWQVPQGLPQATILSIKQTRDGYVWLGTLTGLVRFDGVRFTPVGQLGGESIENAWVQHLYEDNDDCLWVATSGAGLFCIGEGRAIRYTTDDGLPSDDVRSVFCDGKAVWIATSEGLARSTGEPRRFSSEGLTQRDGMPVDQVYAICKAQNGTLWFGGDGYHVGIWDGLGFRARRLKTLPATADVRAMAAMQSGAVAIGTTHGLILLDGEEERRYTTANGLASDAILCLEEGEAGELWIGTREGFARFYQGEFETFRTRDGLSQSNVYALCADREGTLWVGTKHGLNQFVDRRTTPYTVKEGLPSNDTGPVFQDVVGNTWVGTLGEGMARYDGRRFQTVTMEAGLASDTILSLADGEAGGLWIGTDKGLNHLRGEDIDKTYSTDDGLPSPVIQCLTRDDAGNLWVGTDQGIARLDGNRFIRPQGDPALVDASVRAMLSMGGNSLLVAVEEGGIYRCVDNRCEPLAVEHPALRDVETFFRDSPKGNSSESRPASAKTTTAASDSSGAVWIGTHGHGLLLLRDDQRVVNFTTKDGLYDDDIFGIAIDPEQQVWMACSKGIFYVPREQLLAMAEGDLNKLTSTPFTPMEALRTIECKNGVQPSVWEMRDGRIWFSTIRGLIVIDPDHLQRDIPPTPVLVEEVLVNGRSEQPIAEASFPPGEKNIEFRYTALSYISPTRLRFRYMLEGFDKDWIEAGSRREAIYTNLSPGSYRFRVSARNVNGSAYEATPIRLHLERSFYQQPWFLPLCGLAAAGVVWSLYRRRVQQIRQRMELIVAERSRIARELHDTLMQGFSGITMEMQALSSRIPQSPERSTLNEIIRDAGVCLREARRSIAGLRQERGQASGLAVSIAEAARQIAELRDLRLKLRIEPIPPLPGEAEYNLLRIAQEAMANVARHSAATTFEVSLELRGQEVQLSVADNGVGWDIDHAAGPSSGHFGLVGMRERAAQIGAKFEVTTSPGNGTRVSVVYPIAAARHATTSASGESNGRSGSEAAVETNTNQPEVDTSP